MSRILFPAGLFLAAVLLALIARPVSLGTELKETVFLYTSALDSGNTADALELMTLETASGFSESYLSELQGVSVPDMFVFDGTDSRGIRMAGATEESGTRIIWLVLEDGPKVSHDTALDNLLGSAAMLCRDHALADPQGCCPVSGTPYEYNEATGTVICPEGHLGQGIETRSDNCSLKRDSVAAELIAFVEAGYTIPAALEDIYTLSGGEFGRRGGYRCPDNGYKYYELRDGAIYCPFHEESSPVAVTE